MPPKEARRLLGPEGWLGISTHDLDQVREAERSGADYLGFGPVYPSPTKGYREGLSIARLHEAIRATELPVFAIGGIDESRIPELRTAGCNRIAVSSCILQSADPKAAAQSLREGLS